MHTALYFGRQFFAGVSSCRRAGLSFRQKNARQTPIGAYRAHADTTIFRDLTRRLFDGMKFS